MSDYEELQLLQLLTKQMGNTSEAVPSKVLRLFRKLTVRREQRHRRLKHFSDVAKSVYNVNTLSDGQKQNTTRTLDRYQVK